jgi:hypothetical protein
MFVHAIFAVFWAAKSSFSGRNATEREKKRDWLAVDAVFSKLFSGLIPWEKYREYRRFGSKPFGDKSLSESILDRKLSSCDRSEQGMSRDANSLLRRFWESMAVC